MIFEYRNVVWYTQYLYIFRGEPLNGAEKAKKYINQKEKN